MIFDGRAFAKELQSALSLRVGELSKKPVLAAIYNPEDKASRIYTDIKEKKAQELGIGFLKFQITNLNDQSNLKQQITNLNIDNNIDGILIQTTLIDRETDRELCKLIDPKKDCDGLNPTSGVVPATTKAVFKILFTASQLPITNYQFPINFQFSNPKIQNNKICVIGKRGLVGGSILERIPGAVGMSASELDTDLLQKADVIITAVGRIGLIKPDMIKTGAICIDVGYPKGDFVPECAEKSDFFTPVPGGVGPVTVICLFENLIDMIQS